MNCLLRHCEIRKKGQFKHKAAPISLISQNYKMTREIVQNPKSCSKRKKVARNTRSCQKVAEQLVENPTYSNKARNIISLEVSVSPVHPQQQQQQQ